jgi:hypothetical protein
MPTYSISEYWLIVTMLYPNWPLRTNLLTFVFVFKALLSDGEEVGKSCTYKYSVPWFGSSLGLAEGKSTPCFLGSAFIARCQFIYKAFTKQTNTEVEIRCGVESFNGNFCKNINVTFLSEIMS